MEGVSAMGIEMARILEGASEEVREIGGWLGEVERGKGWGLEIVLASGDESCQIGGS